MHLTLAPLLFNNLDAAVLLHHVFPGHRTGGLEEVWALAAGGVLVAAREKGVSPEWH
jgi:hypothetical protein